MAYLKKSMDRSKPKRRRNVNNEAQYFDYFYYTSFQYITLLESFSWAELVQVCSILQEYLQRHNLKVS
jgi:hypothetical protein